MRTFLIFASALALAACATRAQPDPQRVVAIVGQAEVTYEDRNRDGRVDYQKHAFGCCDRDWALVDSDFDGRYDLKLRWGYSYQELPVDLPVGEAPAKPK